MIGDLSVFEATMRKGFAGLQYDAERAVYVDRDGKTVPEDIVAELRHQQNRIRMRERYAMGWTDLRALSGTKPDPVPPIDLSFLDAPSGITIRWYNRLFWRLWRWARRFT